MRKQVLLTGMVGSIFILAAGSALAKDVKISGTHSVSNIEMSCINNNGTFFNTTGGGYGCAGQGGTVTCTSKGKCKGWTPLLANNGGKNAPNGGKVLTTSTAGGDLRRPILQSGPALNAGRGVMQGGGHGGGHH